MDETVKSLGSLLFTFIGMILLVTCIAFYCISAHARSTMYSAIEYVEIYGYDADAIDEFANKTNTAIQVTPIAVDDGFRYQIEVSFHHIFAFLNYDKEMTYSGTTRVVEY